MIYDYYCNPDYGCSDIRLTNVDISGFTISGNGGGIYGGYAISTLSGAPHITVNYAGGNADDLCMDGELTVGEMVNNKTGINLMDNARVVLSGTTNREFRLEPDNATAISAGRRPPSMSPCPKAPI